MTLNSHHCRYGSGRDDDSDSDNFSIPSLSSTAIRATMRRRRRSSQFFITSLLLALISNLLVLAVNASKKSDNDEAVTNPNANIELNENSVVLITGAAGFIGSELAMALERTYNVKKVIGIDSIDSGFGVASIHSNGKRTAAGSSKEETKKEHAKDSSDHSRTEEELAIFEFRRQRAFHLLQTLGSKGHFYRADFRPSIPQYYDMGEVPILDFIVNEHPDITHIVHLADPYSTRTSSTTTSDDGELLTQAVPRIKDQPKSGMIEALLEQLRKIKFETSTMPHFTFASSYEVYNHHPQSKKENFPPFREDKPITTPSSLHGASKIIDEILAQSYGNLHDIPSVGLRFFSVYGPWGQPSSPLFEMAERAVTEPTLSILSDDEMNMLQDVRDYVYIDDAVDALMAAMQYRPSPTISAPKSVVINVGTGVGTSLKDVAHIMEDYLPRSNDDVKVEETIQKYQKETEGSTDAATTSSTESYASIQRAKDILGYEPQVDLKQGLLQTLAWHYDRTFPYGGPKDQQQQQKATKGQEEESTGGSSSSSNIVASNGIASCSPFDKECLKGMPVFPCASECSHEAQCTTSWYDDVLVATRMLTHECSTVMYTVALDSQLSGIPSANPAVVSKASSHVQEVDGSSACNIAFVHENSPLVRRLKYDHNFPSHLTTMETFLNSVVEQTPNKKDGKGGRTLKHGFWTLVPVFVPSFEVGDETILQLLPKLSPGLFFAGRKTTHAIYCDPNVIFSSVTSVLEEAKMQPYLEGRVGGTALLIGKKRTEDVNNSYSGPRMDSDPFKAESIQNTAYRTIRIGAIDEVLGDGIAPLVDSQWLVHMLKVEDSRLFRCDVLGETIQWNVSVDVPGFEFIMALHDMWSRVVVRWNGIEPWWIGDGVISTPQGEAAVAEDKRIRQRRLDEGEEKQEEIGDAVDKNEDPNDGGDRSKGEEDGGDNEAQKDGDRNEGGDGGGDEGGDEDTQKDSEQQDNNVEVQAEKGDEGGDEDTQKDSEQQDNNVEVQAEKGDEGGDEDTQKDAKQQDNNAEVQAEGGDEGGDEDTQKDSKQQDNNAEVQAEKGDEGGDEGAQKDSKQQDNNVEVQAGKEGGKSGNLVNLAKEYNNKMQQAEGKENANLNDGDSAKGQTDIEDGEDDEEDGGPEEVGFGAKVEKEEPGGGTDGESPEDEDEELEREKKKGDTADANVRPPDDDEDGEAEDEKPGDKQQGGKRPVRDRSAYDTWMGVLSSTDHHYFVRIIPSTEVGVMFLDDYA